MSFGIVTSVNGTDYAAWQRRNWRRQYFTLFPEGAATLTGLLSMQDEEDTDAAEFYWAESRWLEKKATVVAKDGSTGGWDTSGGTPAAPQPIVAGTNYRVYVTAGQAKFFRPGDVIRVRDVTLNGGTTFADVYGLVVSVTAGTPDYITFTSKTAGSLLNSTAGIGYTVENQGSAYEEGSLSGQSNQPRWPINVPNFTQIYRDSKTFAATALLQGLEFDQTGPYRKEMRDCLLDHMVGIENAFLFGQKGSDSLTSAVDSVSGTIRRYTGGIIHFLRTWELANGGSFFNSSGYRPGLSAVAQGGTEPAYYTDADMRIFNTNLTAGVLTSAQWEDRILPKLFRATTSNGFEKLVIGGSTAIRAISKYYERDSRVRFNRMFEAETKIGFGLWTIETNFGTLHLKSHPRFNADTSLIKDCFVLDMANIKSRPLMQRNTQLCPNIQAPDFDGRKDEYKSEIGLELQYPETHAYIKGLTSITQP